MATNRISQGGPVVPTEGAGRRLDEARAGMARRTRDRAIGDGERSGHGAGRWGTLAALALAAVVALARWWDGGTDPASNVGGRAAATARPTSTTVRGTVARAPTADGGRAAAGGPAVEAVPAAADAATVVEAIDGDTVRVRLAAGGEATVRLIGIDTPEASGPYRDQECFGAEASARTADLLPAGTTVYLERDRTDADRYDRLLRYLWLDGDGGAVLVNERLVAEGFAEARAYPPDVRHEARLSAAEEAAKRAERGFWGECGGPDTPLG